MTWLLILLSLTGSYQDARQETKQVKNAVETIKTLSYQLNDSRLFDILNDYLKTEVEMYPNEVEIHRIYQDNIDKDSAYLIYKKKAEENPKNPVYLYLLARIERDKTKAIELAKKSIALDKNFYWGYVLLGYKSIEEGKYNEAEKQYKKAVAIDTSLPYAYANLAHLYITQNDTLKAIDYLVESYKKETNNDIYMQITQLTDAIAQARWKLSEPAKLKLLDIKRWELKIFPYPEKIMNLAAEFAFNKNVDSMYYYNNLCYELIRNLYNKDDHWNNYLFLSSLCYNLINQKNKEDSLLKVIWEKPNLTRFGHTLRQWSNLTPYDFVHNHLSFYNDRLSKIKGLTATDTTFIMNLLMLLPDYIYRYADNGMNDMAMLVVEDMKTIAEKSGLKSIKGEGFYHWACIYAKNGQNDSALRYLEKAIDNGFINKEHIMSDPDLADVRMMKEFEQIAVKIDSIVPAGAEESFKQYLTDATPYNFTLKQVDGGNVSLSDLKGKHLIIEFWGIGCYWCGKAAEEIKKIKGKYPEYTVVFINTYTNTPTEIKSHFRENGYDFVDLNLMADKKTLKEYDIKGVPKIIFVDNKGKMKAAIRGYSSALTVIFDKIYEMYIKN